MISEVRSDLVDDADRVIGTALRQECHGNPALIHRAVHVLVFNRSGELLLQKRAAHKQIQPGRWDSSVGGHLEVGEGYREAARREMAEEIGVDRVPLTLLYHSRLRNAIESENVATFLASHDGPFRFPRSEISALRFWTPDDIEAALGGGELTPNFEDEWRMFRSWQRHHASAPAAPFGFCGGDSFPDLLRHLGETDVPQK